jgi:hypothetical protein
MDGLEHRHDIISELAYSVPLFYSQKREGDNSMFRVLFVIAFVGSYERSRN